MVKLDLNNETISERINVIEESLEQLEQMQDLSLEYLEDKRNFAVAEHFLRYALEATFDICAHVLSRIPGSQVGDYKEMAVEMGKQEIIPKEFASGKLYQMGGFRNKLTHLYSKVTPEEIYDIIQEDLGDFDAFLKHIKPLLE